ncbi:MAG: SprB repeat-containing protein, partial [Cyclobacteriaceae bacterium]
MKGNFLNSKVCLLFIAIVPFLAGSVNVMGQCPDLGTATITSTDVTCNGDDNGSLTLTVLDPETYTGNYEYLIIGSPEGGGSLIVQSVQTTDLSHTFTNLVPGEWDWYIQVVDATCPGASGLDVKIEEPDPLTASLFNVIPACTLGTGGIEIDVAGGNGGYIYAWSGPTDPGNVEDPTGLDPGDYSVTITDSEGCTVQILDIFVPVITAADAGPDQVVCEDNVALGGNSYRIPGETGNWSVVSGSGTFSDPSDPNATVTGLSEGDNVFEWFITDDGGICTGTTDQVTITWYNLQLVSPGDILLSCDGIADGSGSFQVSGGNGPFTFTVDQNTTGATTTANASTLDFSNAGPGVIEVTVTDADNCSRTELINISEPPSIVLDNVVATDASCDTGNDGTITATASGGTGPLTYTLLPGAVSNTTGDFTGLAAGDYT